MTAHCDCVAGRAQLRQQTNFANNLPPGAKRDNDSYQSLAGKDVVVVDRAEGRDESKHSTIAGSTAPMRDATSTMVAAEPLIRGD